MSPQSISIISIFVNLGLGVAKLFFGFLTGSMALVADGIHSSLDVFSSFITFLGIKTAKKPIDEKHPYGYFKAESLAGFFVAILLAVSGMWILYESVLRILKQETAELGFEAIPVVVVSVLVTEGLARLKFYYSGRFKNLALMADAEHSRADALSSLGVLIGLLLVPYFSLADVVVAFGIGLYILFESWQVGKEITDSLLDVANKDVEQRIRKICSASHIEIAELRTRMIGSFNFAEIKIKLPPKLKVEQVQKISETLEHRLLSNIPELKQIVISIMAYDMARTVVLPKFGKRIGELKGFERIGPKKVGERVIIPVEKQEIAPQFGSRRYLIIDRKQGRILLKRILENPYFKKDSPHGTRFAKAVRADKVIAKNIGPNARQGLKNFGIEVEITSRKDLASILQGLKENSL